MLPFSMNGERCAALVAVCCSLFVAALRCEAQNLVPNPSFEQIDSCPPWPYYLGFQESSKPAHWEKWLNSPDYFNACIGSSDTMSGVPTNLFGSQAAFDGNAYIGMCVYGNFGSVFREYAGVQLTEPLQVGVTYYLSFRVCKAEGKPLQPVYWACNNTGLLFTMQSNVWNGTSGPPFPPRNHAHLKAEEIMEDTAQWVLVSGEFIADSAYQYMAIGNFYDDLHTDTLNYGLPNASGVYSFVDEVCVSSSPNGCETGNSIMEVAASGMLRVFPNPAVQWVYLRDFFSANGLWFITDELGRTMASGHLKGGQAALEVSSWPPGVYQVFFEGEQRNFVRLVVMH